jgi:hypothetical protein
MTLTHHPGAVRTSMTSRPLKAGISFVIVGSSVMGNDLGRPFLASFNHNPLLASS